MTDDELYTLAARLMPLKRTVQGWAVMETLFALEKWIRGRFVFHPVPVGTKVFDWTVLADKDNRRTYHPTLEDVPAYDGPLTYAESVIVGDLPQEVLLSTYTCHPSMANDNVSGMVVTAALAKWLASAPRRYTYRILFAPETIGALCWLKDHQLEVVVKASDGSAQWVPRIIAGYTINNCGDERAWSFVPSRTGDTLADRAARHVLNRTTGGFWRAYSFADRGSDERQFCAPGVDLPIASVMRSKHGTYPEYHTLQDQLGVTVTAKGLGDTFRCYRQIIEAIEANRTYRVTTIGEPMLSQYDLYPSAHGLPAPDARIARDLCAYSDGKTDLLAIAEATGRPIWEMAPIAQELSAKGLLR